MKELSRIEVAMVKRTAQNVKGLRSQKAKLEGKLKELTDKYSSVCATIEKFEAPIRELTGGYSSEEYLNGMSTSPVDPAIIEELNMPVQPATEEELPQESGNDEDSELPEL